ncbi:MAG: hypothetical protein IJY26_04410 [Clostridia bacterium]|nr:hypothetical protein [Clostridia bacterium]
MEKSEQNLKSAKLKLRLCNFFIALLCVLAMAFLYTQPFWSVDITYKVSAQQLQAILQESLQAEISQEQLEGTDIQISAQLAIDGQDLTLLFVDEVKTVVDSVSASKEGESAAVQNFDAQAMMNSMLNTCKENEYAHNVVERTVNSLVEQVEAMVPTLVSVYVQVLINQTLSGDAPGGPVADGGAMQTLSLHTGFTASSATQENPIDGGLNGMTEEELKDKLAAIDTQALADKIAELLEKESITVEEATSTVVEFLEENKEALELTDEDVTRIEGQVSSALTEVADENGSINIDEIVTDVLVESGIVDESTIPDDAEISEILTAYVFELLGEYETVLYIVFIVFSVIIGLLYLLWGLLLIKSLFKILTGKPMGAFFVKLFTALPFLILVLLPTLAFSNMDVVLTLLAQQGVSVAEISGLLSGINIAFGGGSMAAICTLILFLFGFVYSVIKGEYKRAKRLN